jgi:hypothetical protein
LNWKVVEQRRPWETETSVAERLSRMLSTRVYGSHSGGRGRGEGYLQSIHIGLLVMAALGVDDSGASCGRLRPGRSLSPVGHGGGQLDPPLELVDIELHLEPDLLVRVGEFDDEAVQPEKAVEEQVVVPDHCDGCCGIISILEEVRR